MRTRFCLKYFVNDCRYQIRLKTSMKGSDFIFDCVHLLYYKCHKINFKRSGSHMDSPDQIKKQQLILSIKKIINALNTLQQSHLIKKK